jgi:hypothetical protein
MEMCVTCLDSNEMQEGSDHCRSCKIRGFHGGDYEECSLVGCDAAWLLLRTDVSEERVASVIRMTRIGELGTTLAVILHTRTERFGNWIYFRPQVRGGRHLLC